MVLSHRNIVANVNGLYESFPLSPDDRLLSFLPWAHALGQTTELHIILSMGGSVAFAESVTTLTTNLLEVKPTILVAVPRVFNKIHAGINAKVADAGKVSRTLFEKAIGNALTRLDLAEKGQRSRIVEVKHAFYDRVVFSKIRDRFGGRLRFVVSGGAALSKEVARFIAAVGIVVYEGYGLTETSPIVSCNRGDAVKLGSVGKTLSNVEVRISEIEEGQGEVQVKGDNVMEGYYGLPEQTEAVFTEDGYFKTGDMGMIDAEGFLFITGRVKEQYKLENGKYVVPTPLEEQLTLSPFISQIMIYGANKPFNVALIVPDAEHVERWRGGEEGGDLQDPELIEQIRAELEKYSVEFKGYEKIRQFVILPEEFSVENGMLTPTLKLKRAVVARVYQDKIEQMYR